MLYKHCLSVSPTSWNVSFFKTIHMFRNVRKDTNATSVSSGISLKSKLFNRIFLWNYPGLHSDRLLNSFSPIQPLCAHKIFYKSERVEKLRKESGGCERLYDTFLTPQRVVGKVLVFELNV